MANGGTRVACASKIPRRRAVRARVGVLEDVLEPAGGGLVRLAAMTQLGNGLYDAGHTRTRCPWKRPSLPRSGALAHQKKHSRRAEQSCELVC